MHPEQWLYLKSAAYQWLHSLRAFQLPVSARILVVKLDEIGDMANALHVFPLLKERFPDSRLELLCKPMNLSLVRHFDEINAIHTDPAILDEHFDIRIDLRGHSGSLKAAKKDSGALYLGRGMVRLRNKFSGGQKHEIATNREIISRLWGNQPVSESMPSFRYSKPEEEKVYSWLKERNIKKYAVLHTGARDLARRWPADRFGILCKHLKDQWGMKVLIGGGPDEQEEVNQFIQSHASHALNLCGLFNLNEFAFLCSQAEIFIGNESGPMHLSWISGCPTLALFGPGVPHIFYPLGDANRVIHHFQGHQPGNPESMLNIQTEEVIRTVDAMLHASSV